MKYIVTILLVLFIASFGVHQANATSSTSIDWTTVELSKKESEFPDTASGSFGVCKPVDRLDIVSDMEYMNGATLPYKGCIIEGKDVDMYVASFTDISSENPRNFAIRIKPSGKFYFLKPGTIASASYARLIPGTNIYTEWQGVLNQRKLLRAMDIRAAIHADRFDSTGSPIRYVFDDSSPNVNTYTFNSVGSSISAGPITKDGKVVFWSGNGWLYKMSLEVGTLDVKYMPSQDINWQNVPYGSNQVYPVDPEGRYVYLGGKLDMLIDTDDCGQYYRTVIDSQGFPYTDMAEQTNCKMRSFKGVVNIEDKPGTGVFGVRFEGNKLQVGTHRATPDGSRMFLLEFSPEGQSDELLSSLDYLALGDSYSSGEGDNGIFFGDKYYRKGTDEQGPPQEKCHISTRSYPYLLAKTQELESGRWSTIACSGALVGRDYHDNDKDRYFGQNGRLGSLGDEQVLEYQNEARVNFIPGRVQQVEFVWKFKPRVISVTGGGNDAGFSTILAACADAFRPNDTCTYAGEMDGVVKLGKAIKLQYENVRTLVSEIRKASPESTIYYVGYPQFLKVTDKTCGLGVSLSTTERRVFREANVYLNRVIRAAAESEGAIYVDVEESLKDHLLCGDDPYITTYNADCTDSIANWFKGKDECQESFHPKPRGHALMAQVILKTHPNIMNSQPCAAPSSCVKESPLQDVKVPRIFQEAFEWYENGTTTRPIRGSENLAAQKSSNNHIQITTDLLLPESNTRSYLTSVPTELGNVQVGSDGVLKIDLPVPTSVAAGYHTLHIEGTSKSGDPVELWWIIRIFGKDGDVDEDGVPDDVDKCIFMPTLNIDKDGDGIDDGCDSSVNITDNNAPQTLSGLHVKKKATFNSGLAQVYQASKEDVGSRFMNQNVDSNSTEYLQNNDSQNGNLSNDNFYMAVIIVGVMLLSVGGLIGFRRFYGSNRSRN